MRTRWLSVLLIGLALAACGPQVIEGRPPFIGIAGMSLQGETLVADFRVSNQNGVPMSIQAIDLTVTVDGTELVRENRNTQLDIGANSAEELRIERAPGDAARESLAALDRRELSSLPFELAGRVRTVEDGFLRFEHKGHFYPVPGKPGHFRSAVTQARELRRDDDL